MGWNSIDTLNGRKLEDFIKVELERSGSPMVKLKVLDFEFVKQTCYAAVEALQTDAQAASSREVFAAIVLTEKFGAGLSWKMMDESVGPYERKCPVRILDLLTESTHGYSQEWRRACRLNAPDSAQFKLAL